MQAPDGPMNPTVVALREHLANFALPTKPDPALERDLKPGFLLPYLLEFDALTYGRWGYWREAMIHGTLPTRPIPPIDWLSSPNARTRKMLETALNAIPKHGSWQSMGGWEYFRYLLAWMLWGFGHPGYNEPGEPFGCEGASLRLYQVLNINAWMLWPFDYLGDLLAENAYGKRQGFYPTPMPVALLMARMILQGRGGELRAQCVSDPAVGTGRLLLAASNDSLRLCGCDIDPTMYMATLVNGYLYAPWMARPLPFLHDAGAHGEIPASPERVPTQVPHAKPEETNGAEVLTFEPVNKRQRTGDEGVLQGRLF